MIASIRHSRSSKPRTCLRLAVHGPSGGVNASIRAQTATAEILGILQTVRAYYDTRSAAGYTLADNLAAIVTGERSSMPADTLAQIVNASREQSKAIRTMMAEIATLREEKKALTDTIHRLTAPK